MLRRLVQFVRQRTIGSIGLLAVVALLLIAVAELWWWLPPSPRASWRPPSPAQFRTREPSQVLVSEDGKTLATIHGESLILWDLPDLVQRRVLPLRVVPSGSVDVFIAHLSADGQTVVYADGRHTLVVWNPALVQGPMSLSDFLGWGTRYDTHAVAHGDTVFTWYAVLQAWNLPTGDKERLEQVLSTVTPTSNGELLAVEEDGLSLVVWEMTERKRRCCLELPNEAFMKPIASSRIISKSGRRLAASDGATIIVWDLVNGERLAVLTTSDDLHEFSPDDGRLLTFQPGREGPHRWTLWDLTASPCRDVGAAHCWEVMVSPNGKYLCTAGDADWRLRDASTLQSLGFLDTGRTLTAREICLSAFLPTARPSLQ